MRPFQTKLNVSPRTGARTEVWLFSPDLCGQNSLAEPPSWHLKHVSATASLVLFSLHRASGENLLASLNVTLSASLVPCWHKNRLRSECKEGPYWNAIAQSEPPSFAPIPSFVATVKRNISSLIGLPRGMAEACTNGQSEIWLLLQTLRVYINIEAILIQMNPPLQWKDFVDPLTKPHLVSVSNISLFYKGEFKLWTE